MSKKSYMNNNAILSEGFFDKLYKIIRNYPKLKKDKSIKKGLVDLNNDVSEMERLLNQDMIIQNINLREKQELHKLRELPKLKES